MTDREAAVELVELFDRLEELSGAVAAAIEAGCDRETQLLLDEVRVVRRRMHAVGAEVLVAA